MGTNAVKRDATAETVSANVKRLRTDQNLGLRGLANKLGEVGRPLGHSAVDQIEKGTRRVDVDDLVALARALDVSPVTLLMPQVAGDETFDFDGLEVPVSAGLWWLWLRADAALPGYPRPQRRFFADARPEWSPGPGAYFEDADGND